LDNEIKNKEQLFMVPKSELKQLQAIAKNTTTADTISIIEKCTQALSKTKVATITQLPLEIVVISTCKSKKENTKTPTAERSVTKQSKKDPKEQKTNPTKKSETISEANINKNLWQKCINLIDKQNKSLASLLAGCKIQSSTDKTLTLSTNLPFYQEKLTQPKHRTLIEEAIKKICDKPRNIEVIIHETDKESQKSKVLDYAKQLLSDKAVQ